MVEFKQILCPTDLSEASRPALSYAAAFAGWYHARLSILHVVPTFDAIAVPPAQLADPVQVIYPSTREDITAELRRQAETSGAAAVDPAIVAEAGDAVTVIVERALASSADLIVVGSHGRSGFNRLLHGSVAEQVLLKAPCPVLTVPPHAPATAPPDLLFRRILCAMDFSPGALQALGFALDLGRQADGVVTVLHALEWLAEEEPRVHAHFNVAEYRTYLIEDARERLETLLAPEARTWCQIDTVVAVGRPYRQVLQAAAERSADLIVMGAQGRGGFGLALNGSTTHQVVRAAACPVLTVRGARLAGEG
ncbi:MAG: universal stress protein [Acidobacteriota bacterium]|nr:universal stress protein [Acidobacteriota bacterium]